MPKLLCYKCRYELKCVLNDVLVIEFSDNGPYKLWCADEYGCSTCDAQIITGWGDSPIWRPHEGPILSSLIQTAADKGLLRYDFENELQKARFLALPPAQRHSRNQTQEA